MLGWARPRRDQSISTDILYERPRLMADVLSKKLRDLCADRSGPTSHSLEAIQSLLDQGADVNLPNRNGKTSVHFTAQLRSDTEVLALLLQAHGDCVEIVSVCMFTL